jgi:hypothetical protein
MKRAAIILFVLCMIVLAATAETIYSKPMDNLSVAWFLLLAIVSSVMTVLVAVALGRPFWRRELVTTLDTLFWALFITLPFAMGLLLIAVWTLGWHYLAWQ